MIYAYTGNALIYANGKEIIKKINNCDISKMRMDKISDEKLEDYLTNQHPLDRCAGINKNNKYYKHITIELHFNKTYLQNLKIMFKY